MRAKSTAGVAILGTLESLSGRANIEEDSFHTLPDGTIDFEWEGSTEVFWDEQRTVTAGESKERIFLDEDGNQVPESQIVLTETVPGKAEES